MSWDLYLLAEGKHFELARCLGAQAMTIDGIARCSFSPYGHRMRDACRVVGGFNGWDGRRHPMRKRVEAGVWELFVPRLAPGEAYKYEILGPHGVLPAEGRPGCAASRDSPAHGIDRR